jgi:hypothetical protein
MITITDIEAMSKAERLMAIDLIWSSLSDADKEVKSPAWHGEVLAARMKKIDSGQAKFLTLDELKQRLNAKIS